MKKNITNYENEITTLSLSLLLELLCLLKGYSEDMVLVGGWVPYFLLKRHINVGFLLSLHVGS